MGAQLRNRNRHRSGSEQTATTRIAWLSHFFVLAFSRSKDTKENAEALFNFSSQAGAGFALTRLSQP